MTEAEIWKDEFHIIASDGEARAWLDTLEEAKAEFKPDDKRIDIVTYYHNWSRPAWEPEDGDCCPNGSHCCCECETCCDCGKERL